MVKKETKCKKVKWNKVWDIYMCVYEVREGDGKFIYVDGDHKKISTLKIEGKDKDTENETI